MPKTRSQKANLVEKYRQAVKEAKMVVVVSYGGLTVNQSEEMRDALFAHNERLVIVKNNLLRIALAKENLSLAEDLYSRPLALVAGEEDEVQIAKDTMQFVKQFEQLEPVAGVYEGQVVDADAVVKLASLPSREELLAKVVGTINAPVSGFVNVLRGSLSGLMNVLHQIEQQKQT